MLDEHISWINHVRTVENKIAKSIGLIYRVSQFLNEDSPKTVYFSYIHPYLNYENIAWASTYATKLKSLFETKTTQSKPLFENLSALNVYKINIYQPTLKLYA